MSASSWKPYPEYKESEMKWESSIPEKWKKVRLRFLGKTYGGLTGKKGEDFSKENTPNLKPYIPYTNILNQTYISKNHFAFVFIDEGEKQNLAKAGDLFFLMSSESYQDLGKSSILIDDIDELYLNSFCKGFRVSESMIYPLFLNYQLQGHLHKQLISTEGKGFTRINLSQERLLDTPIFIPSLSEQKQITNFLDKKIPEIIDFIQQLEKTIVKLKEKRLTLITQAVTKGLNSNVTMKNTGLDWYPKVPSHWSLRRVKHIAKVSPSNVDKKKYDNQDKVRLANYVDVYKNDRITEDMELMVATASENEIAKFSLFAGDLIITKDSESWEDIAVPAFVPKTMEGVVCGYHLTLIRPNQKHVLGEYLFRTYQALGVRDQYHYNANGVTRYGLGLY